MPTTDEAGFEAGKMSSPTDSTTLITLSGSPDESSGSNSMVTLVSMDRARFVVEASSMLECKLLKAMVDGEPRRLPQRLDDVLLILIPAVDVDIF